MPRRGPSVRSAPLACHRSSCLSLSSDFFVTFARYFSSHVLMTFLLLLFIVTCCLELLTLSFSFSQARLLSVRSSATSYLATALLSARGLHHCIRRLSCGLLEVGLRYVLDLAASPHLGHLCFSWHVWSRDSFLRNLDLFLKLRHVEEFPGRPHFIWDISCVELERQILRLFPL